MRRARRAMDSDWVAAASDRIQKAILRMPEFIEARSVACYLALPYEVQLGQVIEASWYGNKRLCVPAWNSQRKRYELTWLGRDEPTRHGRWNVQEPAFERRAGVMDVDLLFVPALAFDTSGGRLGHGGGHYDRLLGSWSGLKVGVAFDFQVFDHVPMGKQDIPVDMVITERKRYSSADRSAEAR